MKRSRRDKPTSRKSRSDLEPEDENLEVLEELSEDDELETLEELTEDDEELETLEELEELTEDDGVEITLAEASEDAFDVRMTIAVGDMERGEIVGAVEGPLRNQTNQRAAELKWKRVVVTFTGDAMIPTAAKDLVGEILPEARPLSVTVQRGYPDEVVHEGKKPEASVAITASGKDVRVEVDSNDLEGDDLETALQSSLDKLCGDASGKSITFAFQGAAASAAFLEGALASAGAVRVAVQTGDAEDVLFDKELDELVQVSSVGGDTVVEVAGGKDTETTVKILAARLEAQKAEITGKTVQVNFAEARPEIIESLAKFAATLKPATLSVGEDQLWPTLLKVASKGSRTALKLVPGGRFDVVPALRRELAAVQVAGQELTLDWPGGASADPRIERILIAAKPASLAYSFDGQDKEPIWPAPITFRTDGDVTVCEVNSEAGKPGELACAMKRHVPTQDLNGRKVDVQIQGEGVVSRTMRQTMTELLEAGGATQGRLIEHGNTEYLFPKLLSFEDTGDGSVRIAVHAGDRTEEEIAAATASEMADQDLAGKTVRLPSSPGATTIIEAAIGAAVARVVIEEGDNALQVHPPLITDVSRSEDDLTITATPDATGDALMTQIEHELPVVLEGQGSLAAVTVTLAWHGEPSDERQHTLDQLLAAGPAVLRLDDGSGKIQQLHPEVVRTYVDVLGRREAAEVPITILGVDTDDLEGATGALEKLTPDVEGRRVLVVFREDEREVMGAADNPVVQATLAFLETRARAVLEFRPARRQQPAHFEVVRSSVDGLPMGTKLKDPRG